MVGYNPCGKVGMPILATIPFKLEVIATEMWICGGTKPGRDLQGFTC